MGSIAPSPTEFRDPLRGPDHSRRFWTTVNAAEALPGVPTPMNWSWYDDGTERAMLRGMGRIGAEPTGLDPSDDRDERYLGIFFGRAALNVDRWRAMADGTPGTSGSSLERDLLGAERPGKPTRARPGRYPFVATKAPRAFARARREIVEGAAAHRRWWRESVAGVTSVTESTARSALAAAFANYEKVATAHLIVTMAAQGLYDALGRVCARADRPGLEASLASGLGTEEGEILGLLWRIAREDEKVEALLDEYGYQGPGAGEIANSSWRSEPGLLDPVLERYRSLSDDHAPRHAEARQRSEREQAERELIGAVPRLARRPVGGLLRMAQSYLPLRESGRGTILRSVDAARAAAWEIGRHATAAGRMDRPDDIFMCTIAEASGERAAPVAEELGYRRERWEHYKGMEIPAAWEGIPVATPIVDRDSDGPLTLTGIGVSAGAIEGRVRVVSDPASDGALEPGEILVCQTTDPSWASLFLMAGGVVIDIGGTISHGAIVARELGIPCVINTKDGTRLLRSGDLVRIDGSSGTVERLGSG